MSLVKSSIVRRRWIWLSSTLVKCSPPHPMFMGPQFQISGQNLINFVQMGYLVTIVRSLGLSKVDLIARHFGHLVLLCVGRTTSRLWCVSLVLSLHVKYSCLDIAPVFVLNHNFDSQPVIFGFYIYVWRLELPGSLLGCIFLENYINNLEHR